MSLKANLPKEEMINKKNWRIWIFQIFFYHDNNNARCTREIKSNISVIKMY